MRAGFIYYLMSMLLSGCAGIPKPSLIELPTKERQVRVNKPKIDDSINSLRDRQDTQSLIDETFSIIQSSEFIHDLSLLDGPLRELWLSPYGETISPSQVAVAYLGIDPHHRPVSSTLKWGQSERTGPAQNVPNKAVIEMGWDKLAQWRSASITHKSCAINTLAHELAHTVSQSPIEYTYLFADRGRPWASFLGRPLVSYTLGALAQCTFLRKKGALDAKDLRQCIDRWGTSNFYSNGCSPEQEE